MPSEKEEREYRLLNSVNLYDKRVLQFYVSENIEEPNRGYVCDEISVWEANKKLGYLRTAYLCKNEFTKYNPTIWHYLNNFCGFCSVLNTFGDPDDIFSMSDDKFKKLSESIKTYALGFSEQNDERYQLKNFPDRNSFLKEMEKTEYAKNGKCKRTEHLKRVLDKPFVDFIQTGENKHKGVYDDNKGKGLGFLLYLATSDYYRSEQKPFYSSSLQSTEAERMWKRFAECDWVIPDEKSNSKNKRFKVNYEKMPTIKEGIKILNHNKQYSKVSTFNQHN
jgi:hypothetical protein